MLKPAVVTAPAVDSSLTSAETLRLMRPWVSTKGVKATFTPKVFQETVTVLLFYEIGTGNSPPATNFAVSPEMAASEGSARVRARPTRSND